MWRSASTIRLIPTAAVAALLAACGGAHAPQTAPEARVEPAPAFASVAVVDAGPLAGMHFKHYGVNPTVDTAEEPRSSFALSTDRATWDVTRRHLEQGQLPDPAVVRIEDFVQAFHEDAAQGPEGDALFALHSEAFPSPNRPGYHVLRLALRARQAAPVPVRLVAVVDVLAADGERLALARDTLRQVFAGLGSQDEVAVIGSEGQVLLPPHRPGDAEVTAALAHLASPAASMDSSLASAYALAADAAPGKVRHVIYCGDGRTDRASPAFAALVAAAEAGSALGVGLTTVGLGPGRYDDDRLARLAQAGGGRYAYVDAGTAADGLAEQLPTTRAVVAREARAEVTFDPATVVRYRLLGYERHAERPADSVVAPGGDVPAGQSSGILYEVKLKAGFSHDLGVMRVRHRPLGGGALVTFEATIPAASVGASYAAASGEARLALLVAAFGEKLRGAWWVRAVGYPDLLQQHDQLPAALRSRPEVAGLRDLLTRAAALDGRGDPFSGRAPLVGMDFDNVPIVQ